MPKIPRREGWATRASRLVRAFVRDVADLGVGDDVDPALRKRIRVTNVLALFGAFLMFASIPFDRVAAPVWMTIQDVAVGLACLGVPLLNRMGRLAESRLALLALANTNVLANAVTLGPESDVPLIFIALAAGPFALFDLRERKMLAVGVLVAAACFGVAQSDALARFRPTVPDYWVAGYRAYSAALTFIVLLFILLQIARANARAESELRTQREHTVQSARLAALGEMSGNIAHEVNNPLQVILLRNERLLRLAEDGRAAPAAVVETCTAIGRTVRRIGRIVDSLRALTRDARDEPLRPASVRKIVADTVELCTERFKHHAIALEIDPIPEELCSECRPVQISQVLLNLLSNAHDAVEGRASPWVRLSVDASAGEVRIAVTDSGPGIPPELRPRIMEPFFTTKAFGKGTGLGLSVSRGIAEAHGGSLVLDADAPQTRFVLTLRRASRRG